MLWKVIPNLMSWSPFLSGTNQENVLFHCEFSSSRPLAPARVFSLKVRCVHCGGHSFWAPVPTLFCSRQHGLPRQNDSLVAEMRTVLTLLDPITLV